MAVVDTAEEDTAAEDKVVVDMPLRGTTLAALATVAVELTTADMAVTAPPPATEVEEVATVAVDTGPAAATGRTEGDIMADPEATVAVDTAAASPTQAALAMEAEDMAVVATVVVEIAAVVMAVAAMAAAAMAAAAIAVVDTEEAATAKVLTEQRGRTDAEATVADTAGVTVGAMEGQVATESRTTNGKETLH